jgi:hypothetical protein
MPATAMPYRDVEFVGFDNFGILLRDRRTGDHNFRAGDVLRRVALENSGAQAGQALGQRRTLQIGTGNPVAKVQQHLGNATHADAANAYEMDTLDLGKHKSGKPGHGFTPINAD